MIQTFKNLFISCPKNYDVDMAVSSKKLILLQRRRCPRGMYSMDKATVISKYCVKKEQFFLFLNKKISYRRPDRLDYVLFEDSEEEQEDNTICGNENGLKALVADSKVTEMRTSENEEQDGGHETKYIASGIKTIVFFSTKWKFCCTYQPQKNLVTVFCINLKTQSRTFLIFNLFNFTYLKSASWRILMQFLNK